VRLLVYTDLQATEGSARCRSNPTIPLQRQRTQDFYDRIVQIAKQKNCDHVCDLGDSTDDRSFIYRATLGVTIAGLAKLKPACPGLIKLTGNHEQLLKDGRISADNLYEPYFERVGSGVFNGKGFMIVYRSFTDDYAKLNEDLLKTAEAIRTHDLKEPLILMAHGDVKGARYASGETSSEGISLATLDAYDIVLLGHVHNHQCLIKDKAWYVGSPFQQDFGEAGQRKWVAVLDTDKMNVEFVNVTGFPEYRTVELKDFLTMAKPGEEHRYKVLLRSLDDLDKFYSSPLGELGEGVPLYEDKKQDAVQDVDISDDPSTLLKRYLNSRPIGEGISAAISEDDLLSLGLSFLNRD
jgi:predicted phosphodiesterase